MLVGAALGRAVRSPYSLELRSRSCLASPFLGRSPRNPRAIHEELEQSIRLDVSRSMQFPDFFRREIEVLRPLARIQNLVAFGVSVGCQRARVRWLRRRRWLVV